MKRSQKTKSQTPKTKKPKLSRRGKKTRTQQPVSNLPVYEKKWLPMMTTGYFNNIPAPELLYLRNELKQLASEQQKTQRKKDKTHKEPVQTARRVSTSPETENGLTSNNTGGNLNNSVDGALAPSSEETMEIEEPLTSGISHNNDTENAFVGRGETAFDTNMDEDANTPGVQIGESEDFSYGDTFGDMETEEVQDNPQRRRERGPSGNITIRNPLLNARNGSTRNALRNIETQTELETTVGSTQTELETTPMATQTEVESSSTGIQTETESSGMAVQTDDQPMQSAATKENQSPSANALVPYVKQEPGTSNLSMVPYTLGASSGAEPKKNRRQLKRSVESEYAEMYTKASEEARSNILNERRNMGQVQTGELIESKVPEETIPATQVIPFSTSGKVENQELMTITEVPNVQYQRLRRDDEGQLLGGHESKKVAIFTPPENSMIIKQL